MSEKSTVRVAELDLLRALAIVLVLFRHLRDPSIHAIDAAVAFSPLVVLSKIGWAGVDLFFVLSGFLVSGLLFREFLKKRRVDGVRFLIRRGFKIYPAFYLFLFISFLVAGVYSPDPSVWRGWPGLFVYSQSQVFGELLFLQNYLGSFWSHTWSLAVEEHFYFALVLVVLGMQAQGKDLENPFFRLPRVFFAVAALVLMLLYLAQSGRHLYSL